MIRVINFQYLEIVRIQIFTSYTNPLKQLGLEFYTINTTGSFLQGPMCQVEYI